MAKCNRAIDDRQSITSGQRQQQLSRRDGAHGDGGVRGQMNWKIIMADLETV